MRPINKQKTNRAVSALIFKDNKCLLLKRRNSPRIWGPPGGRVFVGETLMEAIKREILEETGLNDVEILMPLYFWAGKHGKDKLEAMTFLCRHNKGKIVLSSEHESYKWMSLPQIKKMAVTHSLDEFNRGLKILKTVWK